MSAAVSAVQAAEEQSGMVTVVEPGIGKCVHVNNALININKLGNNNCALVALCDTGSPISLVRYNVFDKFFNGENSNLRTVDLTYKALNSRPIPLLGIRQTAICIEQIPVNLEADLHVLTNNSLSTDLIFGRDFFKRNKDNRCL